jgi:hypothetical protein
MNINWILSLFLLPLYYIFGFVITALITLLDGFVGTFTKYHCVLFMIFTTISFFDMMSICWWIGVIAVLYFVGNYDRVVGQYVTLKRTIENTLKMIELEKKLQFKSIKLTQNDILMIENTNKMFNYVDNVINYIQSSYDSNRSKLTYFAYSYVITKCDDSVKPSDKNNFLCDNVNKIINDTVIKSFPAIYDNVILLYELLLDIQPIGKYIIKIREYYDCCLLLGKEDNNTTISKNNDSLNMEQLNDMNNLIEGLFMSMPSNDKVTKTKSKQFDPTKLMTSFQTLTKSNKKLGKK